MSPRGPDLSTQWEHPARIYDHRRGRDARATARRSAVVPYAVSQYIEWSSWFFDAARFGEVPETPTGRQVGLKRSRDQAWVARWQHLPLTPTRDSETHGSADLPHVRCWEERGYQHRIQKILSDLDRNPLPDVVRYGDNFLPKGHSFLGLMATLPPYDRMYWLRDRVWWGDNCADDARVRSRHLLFFGWHNQEFHDMPVRRRSAFYVPVPDQAFYRDVPRHLCVPTPAVLAYHSSLLLRPSRLRTWVWQIVHVEWAISSLMAFLYTARYGVPINSKCTDWRLYNDEDLPSPPGRLFPLPDSLVQFVRKLGLHNVLRETEYRVEEVETLLTYVAETDWSKTPGFLWYDYDSDTFAAIPRHPAGRDDAKEYPTRVVLPLGRRPPLETFEADDYYPRGKGFVEECLQPCATASALVPWLEPNAAGAFSASRSLYGDGSHPDPLPEEARDSLPGEVEGVPVEGSRPTGSFPGTEEMPPVPAEGVPPPASTVAAPTPPSGVAAPSRPPGVFSSEEPVRSIDTTEFLNVPPVEDEALKRGWADYVAGARAQGEEIKDSVPDALSEMRGLYRDRGRLYLTQRALAEVRTAFGTVLQEGIRSLTDQTIAEIIGRFGLEDVAPSPAPSNAGSPREAVPDADVSPREAPSRKRPRTGPFQPTQ